MKMWQKIAMVSGLAVALTGAASAQCAECDKASCKTKACSADCSCDKSSFSVKFPSGSSPHTHNSAGVETRRAGSLSVSVISGSERRGGQKLMAWLPSKLTTPLAQMSIHEVKISGYTGYELVGLDKKGNPTQIRYVKTADHDYLVVASGFDTRVNQDFVSSFHLQAPSVAGR